MTFDVYGTLIDWEESVKEAVLSVASDEASATEFMNIVRTKQLAFASHSTMMEVPHMSFAEITRRSFISTCRKLQLNFRESDLEIFVDAWYHGIPYPDVVPNLKRIEDKVWLVLFSNGDEAMLKEIVKRIPVKFHAVIGADMIGLYKPAKQFYTKGVEMLKLPMQEIAHVCRGQADAYGAKAAGLKVIWVNRGNEPFDEVPHKPDLIVRDFNELSEAFLKMEI